MTDFDVTPPGDEFARARLPGVADGEVGASGGDAEPGGDEGFVIEELSRRTGLTVRSLRSYQTQRLLPPPTVRGRTGYYGEPHVARIELIKDLQSQGLKLSSIARLVDGQVGSEADLLRFTRTVTDLFGERRGGFTSATELAARFGVDAEDAPALIAQATELGLVQDVGDGTLEELAPGLIGAGQRAVEVLHLDAAGALRVLGTLRKQAEAVADTYLELFLERVWAPFVQAGRPAEQWSEVEAALLDVRALATEALVSTFELVMSDRVADVVDREVVRGESRSRRRGGRGR